MKNLYIAYTVKCRHTFLDRVKDDVKTRKVHNVDGFIEAVKTKSYYSTRMCTLYTKKTRQRIFGLSEYNAFLGGHHRRVAPTAERGPKLVYLSQHFVHPENITYCSYNCFYLSLKKIAMIEESIAQHT